MKDKRLEKKVQFIFKKKPGGNLSKDQMRTIRGGEGQTTTDGDRPSTEPGCVENKPTVGTVSL